LRAENDVLAREYVERIDFRNRPHPKVFDVTARQIHAFLAAVDDEKIALSANDRALSISGYDFVLGRRRRIFYRPR